MKTNEKYLKALIALREDALSGKVNKKAFSKKHSISNNFINSVIALGFMNTDLKWTGGAATQSMADGVLQYGNTYIASSKKTIRKSKAKKTLTVATNKTTKNKTGVRRSTIERCKAAIHMLIAGCKNKAAMTKKLTIGNTVVDSLFKSPHVKFIGKKYKWVGPAATLDVTRFAKELAKEQYNYKKQFQTVTIREGSKTSKPAKKTPTLVIPRVKRTNADKNARIITLAEKFVSVGKFETAETLLDSVLK